MEMIKVIDVSKSYGKIKALKNVSFSVNEGEMIGYVGPNGAGKTTTIKTITGLCTPVACSGLPEILAGPLHIFNVNFR